MGDLERDQAGAGGRGGGSGAWGRAREGREGGQARLAGSARRGIS